MACSSAGQIGEGTIGKKGGPYFMKMKTHLMVVGLLAILTLPSMGTAAPDQYNPTAVYDPVNNRYLFVFEVLTPGLETDLYGQFRTRDGAPLSVEFMISVAAGNQTRPSVSYDSVLGQFFVVWEDNRNSGTTHEDIYGQLITGGGLPVGGNFSITNNLGTQGNPSVSFDYVDQTFLVVWRDGRNLGTTGEDIYGQRVNLNGSLAGGDFPICNFSGDQSEPVVSFDGINLRFLVAWTDSRNLGTAGEDIYGQWINADGSPFGENFAVSDALGDQVTPAISDDPLNLQFLVVWTDGRDVAMTGEDIYGQRVSIYGILLGTSSNVNFVISDASGDQGQASAAYDAVNQRFMVVWADSRNVATTGLDLYGQIVNPDGSLSTTPSNFNFLITNAVNAQDLPDVVFNSNCGNFVVVFQTDETGVPEVAYTLLGSPCQVVYTEVQLLSPNGGEVLPSGSLYSIQWGAPSEAVTFKLEYSKNNGKKWKKIVEGVTGSGYVWQVPATVGNKEKCLVRVTGYDASRNKVGKDKSNAVFEIAVLKVATPSGGEMWTSGQTVTVTWLTGATTNEVAKVQVLYTKNGGKDWKQIAILKRSNPGILLWKVPDVSEIKTKCKVKVKLRGSSGKLLATDKSESIFTILPAP
jgi:hypothetical protein